MVLIFADGRGLPVNYLREGGVVYAGSDGRWWRAFREGDVLMIEFDGRWGGYISQIDQLFMLGRAPQDVHDAMALAFESYDRVAAAAGPDPAVLRLENLDTDIPVPEIALAETRRAAADDDCNSWLPLTGRIELREAVARRLDPAGGFAIHPLPAPPGGPRGWPAAAS